MEFIFFPNMNLIEFSQFLQKKKILSRIWKGGKNNRDKKEGIVLMRKTHKQIFSTNWAAAHVI
jgi:hypothetical protein